MTPEQTIRDATRLREFMQDDAIASALGRMERRYYELFVSANSSEERIRAQAKAQVLRDFLGEVVSVMDAGEVEVLNAAKQASSRPTR